MPPKKKLKPSESQHSITNFFHQPQSEQGSSNYPVNHLASNQMDEVQSNKVGQSESHGKVQKTENFKEIWLTLYPWLEYENGENVMYCKLCKKAGQDNTMTQGCKTFKTSSLARHVETTSHQIAVKAPLEYDYMKNAAENAYSREEAFLLVHMKAVYFLAKEGLPMSKYKPLLELLSELGTPNVELKLDEKIAHDSSYTASEMLCVISDTIEESLDNKLSNSPTITVLADESTDINVKKRLILYAQILDKTDFKVSTHFITNVEMHEGTGKAISETIYEVFAKKNIPAKRINGLGSDGAAVMTGRSEGTTGYMLRRNGPHLINFHCLAHREALCTSQAAKKVPALQDYQETLTSLFLYTKHSPNKGSKLKDFQKVLDDPQLKYKEVYEVRWLSFFTALETVFKTIDSLL